MEWRRAWAGWLSGAATAIILERPYIEETLASCMLAGAVYLGLGYLRRGG